LLIGNRFRIVKVLSQNPWRFERERRERRERRKNIKPDDTVASLAFRATVPAFLLPLTARSALSLSNVSKGLLLTAYRYVLLDWASPFC
jgi:hypothetical protein